MAVHFKNHLADREATLDVTRTLSHPSDSKNDDKGCGPLAPEKKINPALTETALAYSPQMAVDPQLGSLLSPDSIHIPRGVEIVDDHAFRVNFHAPAARSVALRTFQGSLPLERQPDGVWTALLPIGTGGFRPLFFVVDDVPVINPMAPIGFGASVPVNTADLPQPDMDFYLLRDVPHGAVSQEYYRSTTTGRLESCLVYTPPGYMRGGQSDYPVLYLQHGHGENERCWVHQGKVNFILDNLLAAGQAVPCIIVMNNGMVQEAAGEQTVINPTLLERLLLDDCIPYIERTYRARTGRLDRAMAGLSMGSLQTSLVTLSHPEQFAWAGIFSGFVQPVLRLVNQSDFLKALDDAAAFKASYRLFFRAIGQDDPFIERFQSDSALLEQKGLAPAACTAHRIVTYPGSHEWNVWRCCIRDFLQLVFQ
jgi:enterochelin esterase-like enzyme